MLIGSAKKKSEWNVYLILCPLFCLPLFFINVKDSHDWGDDFAQYILQAKNIVEKKPQTETGYIYDKTLAVVAPPAYPAGFPLMLAVVYAWKGNSIGAFSYLITLFLFLLCIALFLFFRNYFSGLASFLLVLIFAYNPWTVNCKMEILSDIPFSFFLLTTTLLYLNGRNSFLHYVLTGIACGITLSIRGVGLVFLMAFIFHTTYLILRQIKKGGTAVPQFKNLIAVTGTALGVYFLLNYVLVKVPTGTFLEFYSAPYKNKPVGDVVVQNLNYYVAVFEQYFNPWVDDWKFVTLVSKSFALVLLLIGLLYSLLHKRSFLEVLVVTYILLFIFYPYSYGGFRFILPLIPFLLYYMAIGLMQVKINIPVSRTILIVTGGLFVLLLYKTEVNKILESGNTILHGPQERSSTETFQFIRQHIPEVAIIVFSKPKALALYTGRRTFSTLANQPSSEVKNMLNRLHAEYLLLNDDADLHDESLQNYMKENQNEVHLLWNNDQFFLYKRD